MDTVAVFLTGTGFTVAVSLAVIVYLNKGLSKVLSEVCGTEERAVFWRVFSNTLLILTPVLFTMHRIPGAGSDTPALLEIVTQLKWGLIGLVLTVALLGHILNRHIMRLGNA